MVGEKKKEDDIVGRLEALRKKVPPAAIEKPPAKPAGVPGAPDERRRRIARIVGVLVILIVLGSVFLVGYNMFIKPMETPPPSATVTPSEQQVQEQARLAELAKAKSEKIGEINDAFAGLPAEYSTEKAELIQEVQTSSTKEAVEAVDYENPATNAWRAYRKAEVDKKAAATGGAVAQVGDMLIKGAEDIKNQIDITLLSELKGIVIKEMRSEFIPIRLPRDQITGGFAEVGDRINIHYRWTEKVNDTDVAKIKYLAKDGKVVTIMRAAGTIALSETEAQSQSGGGTEGKGNVTSMTLGSTAIAISDGPYGASIGFRQLQKSSSYTVNLAEVQKAAASSKVSEEELMENLEKYGVRLTEIERETNIGDFTAEYLMLVEVSEEEASEVVLRLLDAGEKANILVTISKTPSWAS
ncbi:MAG: DUF515 domain-containing protein [Candidatus Hydrothermarchaeales archaeon]